MYTIHSITVYTLSLSDAIYCITETPPYPCFINYKPLSAPPSPKPQTQTTNEHYSSRTAASSLQRLTPALKTQLYNKKEECSQQVDEGLSRDFKAFLSLNL